MARQQSRAAAWWEFLRANLPLDQHIVRIPEASVAVANGRERNKAAVIASVAAPTGHAEAGEDLTAHIAALTRLHDLAMQLAGPVELDTALASVLQTIVELHNAQHGLLSLYDRVRGVLFPGASIGFDEAAIEQLARMAPGPNAGACGSAFATMQRTVVYDAEADPRFDCCREAVRRVGFRSVHSTPILTRSGEILGVLSVHFDTCRRPTRLELQLADMCARHAAEVIEATRSQEALRESERRYRELVHALPAAIYATDAEGHIALYNEAAVALWGREPSVGHDRWCGSHRMYWPDGTHLPLDRCPMAIAIQEGTPLNGIEAVVERPDGTRRDVLAYPHLVRDSSGVLAGAINVLVDITERKQAEQQLAEVKEELGAELAGMVRLHEIGTRLVRQGGLRALLAEVVDAAVAITGADTGTIDLLETPRPCPDAMLDAEASAVQSTPLLSRSGSLLGTLSIHHRQPRRPTERELRQLDLLARQTADLIEKARAEDALREREERERSRASEMQATMDAVPAGIFIARDPDCSEVTANRMGCDLLRLPAGSNPIDTTADGLRQAYFKALKDGAEIPTAELPLHKVARLGRPIRNFEFDLEFTDGTRRHLFGNAVPLRADGHSRGAVGAFIDITENRRMEERLREAQKLESVGVLAGGIAHDFNNILVGVLGNASLAADMVLPGSPVQRLLEQVVMAGERAAHLTRQMLAYAGKGQFVIEQVDLSDLARETVSLVQRSISKKIRLHLDLAAGLPTIEADRSQLQQVVMNLVLNAAEAIGDNHGLISITTALEWVGEQHLLSELNGTAMHPGPHVCIQVRDSGCGMDEKTRSRIFEPFFTTKFTGRGLGLAAVAGVVRGHKGAVRVTSIPERGTTFAVMFPASVGQVGEGSGEAVRREFGGSGGILIVDDEDVVLRTARLALERRGYRVFVAETGESAVEVFRREASRIDLVLLDLSMPGMSGHETLLELKKMRPDIRALVSSGYSEAEAFRHFSGQKILGFIQKPYTAARLAEKVKSVLANADNQGAGTVPGTRSKVGTAEAHATGAEPNGPGD